MQKPSKKVLSAIVTTMFVVACSNQNQVQNLPTKNDNKFEVKALPSGDPSVAKLTSLPTPPLMNPINDLNEVKNEEKLDFDTPPVIDSTNAVDGAITVIYKNSHKVRLEKKLKKIKSIASNLTEVSSILDKYKLMDSNDLGDEKQTDAEMDKMQNDFQKKHNVDIPHLKSIHYYQFPKGTDTVALCKELMKLPMVRMAYPTPKISDSSTTTFLGSTSIIDPNPILPNDTFFAAPRPESDYYWFKRHSVFKAWDYYGATALPNIGVIDSSFYPSSSEINFANGTYVTNNGNTIQSVAAGNCPNNSCLLPDASSTSSHGTWVSSVAAAKKNNNKDLCGIAPGATITPIKYDYDASGLCMTKAIQIAANDPNIDVISISQSFNNIPISNTIDVNAQISYAVSTKNKPVVIAAGNALANLNTASSTLAVVVGGSMPSTTTNKSKAWVDPVNTTLGSSYTTTGAVNIISLSASAYNISATGYNRYLNQEGYNAVSGTSFSTPMVSATLGMMKKINPTLNATQLSRIVTYSSNLYTYENNGATSNKFIGTGLTNNSTNNGLVAGLRDLNTYNALLIAKNSNNYNAIIRSYNIDDYVVAANSNTYNAFTPSSAVDSYGVDTINGINSISTNSYINFAEYNISGGCAYGYQVYRNGIPVFDKFGGVSGVAGVPTGCNPVNNNYNYPMAYLYN